MYVCLIMLRTMPAYPHSCLRSFCSSSGSVSRTGSKPNTPRAGRQGTLLNSPLLPISLYAGSSSPESLQNTLMGLHSFLPSRCACHSPPEISHTSSCASGGFSPPGLHTVQTIPPLRRSPPRFTTSSSLCPWRLWSP